MFIRSTRKFITLGIVTAFLTAGIIGTASAQQPAPEEQELLLNAFPELINSDTKGDQVRSGSAFMECFVDTPAFDQFSSPFCLSNGTSFTTSAVFRIANPPSNFTILWSDNRCDSSSLTCILPIRQFQTITLDATVLNNSNSTFVNTSATARYEGFQ